MVEQSVIENAKSIPDVLAVCHAIGLNLTGRGEWLKGRCPFHADKTASFGVHKDKGTYNCFGCGEKGDIINLVSRITGMGFSDSVRLICENSGIRFYETEKNHDKQMNDEDLAVKSLKAVCEYIDRHQHGRFNRVKLHESGLSDHLNRIGMDDLPREYLVIRSITGIPVAVAGRRLDGGNDRRWMNSHFKKKDTMYGYYETRKASGPLYVVEGYGDVERLALEGFAACAVMGTALSQRQLSLLMSDGRPIVLCFDGDKPGRDATIKASMAMLEVGLEHSVHIMPDGYDPGEVGLDGYEIPGTAFLSEHYADALKTGTLKRDVPYSLRQAASALLDSRGEFDAAASVLIVRKPNYSVNTKDDVVRSYSERIAIASGDMKPANKSEEAELIAITDALGDAHLWKTV